MKVVPLDLAGVKLITPARFRDERGFFCETWSRPRFAAAGIDLDWAQDNHSFSSARFTLRGLHYQAPPLAQDKLVRVISGEVFDVVVDLRKGSPTYRRWLGVRLSAESGDQLLAPKGFAHGFLTLTPDVHLVYKVSAPYSAEHDRTIRYDDPAIGVIWPLEDAAPVLSAKDDAAPSLEAQDPGFVV